MSNLTLENPEDEMLTQIASLRVYADRVVPHGEWLDPNEEWERASLVKQFLAKGESIHLTRKEMVGLLLDGLFHM